MILGKFQHFQKAALGFLMVALFGATLSACGFRLRGAVDLPYRTVYINGLMSVEFRQNLVRAIEVGTNAKVITDGRKAELIIDILQEQHSKQILSYNASGQITAYRLVSSVRFRVMDELGDEILPESDIYLTRDMDFSVSTVQASENLEMEFLTNMREDITAQILRRIAALQKRRVAVVSPEASPVVVVTPVK